MRTVQACPQNAPSKPPTLSSSSSDLSDPSYHHFGTGKGLTFISLSPPTWLIRFSSSYKALLAEELCCKQQLSGCEAADKPSSGAGSATNPPDRRRLEHQLILNMKARWGCVKEKLRITQLVPAL